MNDLIKTFSAHNKALLAGLITFLGAFEVGLQAPGALTSAEVISAIIAGLVAVGGVHIVPNVGMAKVQDVVDAVRAVVPEQTAASVTKHVAEATGLLKDAA